MVALVRWGETIQLGSLKFQKLSTASKTANST